MSLPVHLVPTLDGVGVGDEVVVEGDEAHHAVVVRRLRTGERVVLTDGRGRSVTAEVATTGKRVFTALVAAVVAAPRPAPELVVVQALPKGDRGELAVEVLTEVGAAVVVPWAAARCVAVWKGERATKSVARWRATAREAAKQSRRAWFPEVAELASTADVAALVAAPTSRSCCTRTPRSRWRRCPCPAEGRIVVVVGPEGGLADDEVATLVAAGGRAVRLGPEVLRTSTAGVVAAAALLARTPRWA